MRIRCPSIRQLSFGSPQLPTRAKVFTMLYGSGFLSPSRKARMPTRSGLMSISASGKTKNSPPLVPRIYTVVSKTSLPGSDQLLRPT